MLEEPGAVCDQPWVWLCLWAWGVLVLPVGGSSAFLLEVGLEEPLAKAASQAEEMGWIRVGLVGVLSFCLQSAAV